MFHIGQIVEISKAYDHTTGARTMVDEVAHCQAEIVALPVAGTDVCVWIKGMGEVYINRGRIVARKGS